MTSEPYSTTNAIADWVPMTLQANPIKRSTPTVTMVMITDISRLWRLVRGAPRMAKQITAKAIG